MVASAPSVDAIRDSFPFPTIPSLTGQPTYESIRAFHMKLKSNAASIPSTLGGGNHGLLGLVLAGPTYQLFTGHAFALPINPGAVPVIPAGATAAHTGEIVRQHAENLRIFQETQRTDQALKQQLLNAIDEMYTRGLRNAHTGYSNVTTFGLLTHLYNTYGSVTSMDLEQNDICMKQPYDPTQPIEVLFNQIETAQEFAEAANTPYPNASIISTAYLLVFKTGMYRDACREWNRRAAVTKTWDNFKADFSAAHQELRELQTLNQQPGFQNQQMNNVMDQYHTETLDSLRQMQEATLADRETMANMAQANQRLNQDITSMTRTLETMLTRIGTLEAAIQATNGNGNNNRRRNENNESYCWLHGRTRRDDHTSGTCRNKKPGHIDTATLHNRQGGSNRYCGD